jgi:hypothetical protein
VTLVALPLARSYADTGKGWALFEAIERRFAAQIRFSIPLAGATGFWMAWRLDLWGLFAEPAAWWMDAMVLLWALFMLIVFVVEPLAHRRVAAMAMHGPRGARAGVRAARIPFPPNPPPIRPCRASGPLFPVKHPTIGGGSSTLSHQQ